MPFMRIGLFLVTPGREAEAAELEERVLAQLGAAPGCRFVSRILGRVGHGGRWQGWVTSWDGLDALEAASAATEADAAALRALAEPRTCQEVVLETESFGPGAGEVRTVHAHPRAEPPARR